MSHFSQLALAKITFFAFGITSVSVRIIKYRGFSVPLKVLQLVGVLFFPADMIIDR